jgi:hypothetical protein
MKGEVFGLIYECILLYFWSLTSNMMVSSINSVIGNAFLFRDGHFFKVLLLFPDFDVNVISFILLIGVTFGFKVYLSFGLWDWI